MQLNSKILEDDDDPLEFRMGELTVRVDNDRGRDYCDFRT